MLVAWWRRFFSPTADRENAVFRLLQRIVIICALSAVIVGYGSAVLFQAFYNIAERGKFVIDANTGATFYGGLIGGAGAFLLVYFIAGKHFCKDNEAVKRFPDMLDIGACCIPLAHAFGRLGCLTAGCCHGRETDAWYGINMYNYTNGAGEEVWHRVVPIQLFESIFLFALAAVLIVLFSKTGKHKFPLMPLYCVGCGIWRFYRICARGRRGNTFIPFLPLAACGGVADRRRRRLFSAVVFKWRKLLPNG
ncbi:MAG: prolipoprotein diacylglyceryl transferase family protein [Christensenellaceae bacterium]